MAKIILTVELSALDKSKIFEEKYTDKDGKEVVKKMYKMECVDLLAPKEVAHGDGWVLNKTHFLAEPQTKQEREMKFKSVFLGEGVQFASKDEKAKSLDDFKGRDEVTEEELGGIPF